MLPNRALRQAGWLSVRPGPFGEILDTVREPGLRRVRSSAGPRLRSPTPPTGRASASCCSGWRALAACWRARSGSELGLRPRASRRAGGAGASRTPGSPIRSGSTTARRPDYARTVDIHRKPGYDPCELFFDPKLLLAEGRAVRRLLQKKLGFRTLFDVVPLDASLVRGSHGVHRRGTPPIDRLSSAMVRRPGIPCR